MRSVLPITVTEARIANYRNEVVCCGMVIYIQHDRPFPFEAPTEVLPKSSRHYGRSCFAIPANMRRDSGKHYRCCEQMICRPSDVCGHTASTVGLLPQYILVPYTFTLAHVAVTISNESTMRLTI